MDKPLFTATATATTRAQHGIAYELTITATAWTPETANALADAYAARFAGSDAPGHTDTHGWERDGDREFAMQLLEAADQWTDDDNPDVWVSHYQACEAIA